MQDMTPFDGPGDSRAFAPSHTPVAPPMEHARHMGLMRTAHRKLRGRYWLALPIAIIGALLGAYGGWKSQQPAYRSAGSVMIQYQLDSVFSEKHTRFVDAIPMYEEFLTTQTYVITARRTIKMALTDPIWLATGRGSDPDTVTDFAENLIVEHPRATQTVHIIFTDRDPGVAAAAVAAIIRAYETLYHAGDKQIELNALTVLDNRMRTLRDAISVERKMIDEIATAYGAPDLTPFYNSKVAQVTKLEAQISAAKLQLSLLQGRGDASKIADELTNFQIGLYDMMMRSKLQVQADLQAELRRLEANWGERNPKVLECKRAVESINAAVEEYGKYFRDFVRKNGGLPGNGTQGTITVESLQKELASLNELYETTKHEMIAVGNQDREIQRHKETIKDYTEEIGELDRQKAVTQAEHFGPGRLQVINPGEIPVKPHKDHRKAMAAVCGFGGAALPLLFFVLVGYADKRYRYSDQAEGGDGMPPLLGILPTLPDRLSDPEQAAIAAHCIHQLRIMLQVNGGTDRKAYMITSASAGDGKTSLTMALGLSFAASGSRTLVIDSDMVGQGLTSRLKAHNSPGLLEALGAGTLNQRVKKTTTQNLYILPIGCADSAHAGGMSPVSIAKLLNEARRIFDCIIIDTGPIMGSLEAAVVGAAADAVILTVARGQHEPMVERSVRRLRQIGANIAGLVFNRAEERDFQRSISSSSIRSMSGSPHPPRIILSEGADESRFGPLARSVASFMPSNVGSTAVKELPAKTSAKVASSASKTEIANEVQVEVTTKATIHDAEQDTATDTSEGAQ